MVTFEKNDAVDFAQSVDGSTDLVKAGEVIFLTDLTNHKNRVAKDELKKLSISNKEELI